MRTSRANCLLAMLGSCTFAIVICYGLMIVCVSSVFSFDWQSILQKGWYQSAIETEAKSLNMISSVIEFFLQTMVMIVAMICALGSLCILCPDESQPENQTYDSSGVLDGAVKTWISLALSTTIGPGLWVLYRFMPEIRSNGLLSFYGQLPKDDYWMLYYIGRIWALGWIALYLPLFIAATAYFCSFVDDERQRRVLRAHQD